MGAVAAPPELDYDCGPGTLGLERSRWLEIRSGLVAESRAMGGDLIVTKSHGCQREWCDAADDSLRVRNYISLIADGLGLERRYPSNPLTAMKQVGESEAIVQLTRASWSTHGLSASEAREMAARYDWSGRSTSQPPP